MVTLDFDKLDGNNYAMWAVNMKSYLMLKLEVATSSLCYKLC
jgi:hypothetical protein